MEINSFSYNTEPKGCFIVFSLNMMNATRNMSMKRMLAHDAYFRILCSDKKGKQEELLLQKAIYIKWVFGNGVQKSTAYVRHNIKNDHVCTMHLEAYYKMQGGREYILLHLGTVVKEKFICCIFFSNVSKLLPEGFLRGSTSSLYSLNKMHIQLEINKTLKRLNTIICQIIIHQNNPLCKGLFIRNTQMSLHITYMEMSVAGG